MRLIQADTYLQSLHRLEAREQTNVKAAAMDFFTDVSQHGKPRVGLRYHRIDRTVRDPGIRSFSVGSLRVIVHENGGDYVLLYVDHHDPAYDWASRRRLQPNPETGAMQLTSIEEVTQVITRTVTQTHTYPFKDRDPTYLMALGVPEDHLDAVRNVSEEHAIALLEILPDEVSERLFELMEGKLVLPPVRTHGDPYDHPDARRHFSVTTDEAELARAIQGRWEDWMIYLHPTQRTLAERHQGGPVKVSGSAGTGKTVVALHRAASLARQRPNARILLTSYSRPLAARLDQKLQQLLPDARDRRHVDVLNIHRLALTLARRWHRPSQPVSDAELEQRLQAASRDTGSELPLTLLLSEWKAITEPQYLCTWDAYRAAPRTGRGIPLGARQRRAIWTVHERTLDQLAQAGQTTWALLCHDVARELQQRGPLYDHVITDEAQDFGPPELALLRALVSPGENDLFLCGDPGQRIFRGRSSWLACGVDIRGRAHRLKVNYRTSREIRQLADHVLGQVLDEEGQDDPRRSISRFSGPHPELEPCTGASHQVDTVATWITARLQEGYQPGEIALFTRRRNPRLQEDLERVLNVRTQALDDEAHDPERLTVTTMHRAKGMEYRAVILADVSRDELPSPQALQDTLDPSDRDALLESERQLVYVAMTRARERLLVTWQGERSALLGEAASPVTTGQTT